MLVLLLRLVRGGLAPLLLQMSDQALPSTQGRRRLLLLRALLLRLLLPSPLLLQSRRRCCCALALLHLLQRYAALGLRDIFKHPLQLSLRVEGGERGGDVAAAVTFPTYSPESQRCLQARCPALYRAASECKQAGSSPTLSPAAVRCKRQRPHRGRPETPTPEAPGYCLDPSAHPEAGCLDPSEPPQASGFPPPSQQVPLVLPAACPLAGRGARRWPPPQPALSSACL